MPPAFVLVGISSIVRSAAVQTDLLVDVSHPEFPITGLRVRSVIRLHKIVTVESKVIVRRLGLIGPLLQTEVDKLLRLVLGL